LPNVVGNYNKPIEPKVCTDQEEKLKKEGKDMQWRVANTDEMEAFITKKF
jgi:hypothetical protein